MVAELNVKSVKSMVELHENQITKANATTSSSPISPLPSSNSNSDLAASATSALPKTLSDLKLQDNGNESESDLEDGLLTESIIFPNPNKIIIDTTVPSVVEAVKKETIIDSAITASPISTAATPTTTTTTTSTPSRPTTLGDSPLADILKSIGELSAKEQEIVKANLERLGGYPAELPLSDSWTLYFSDTSRATKSSHSATQEQYTESQTPIFTVTSVPALCGSLKAYKRLVRSKRSRNNEPDTMGLAQFRAGMNLHCFRSYSKPTWEDPWNQKVRSMPSYSSRQHHSLLTLSSIFLFIFFLGRTFNNLTTFSSPRLNI